MSTEFDITVAVTVAMTFSWCPRPRSGEASLLGGSVRIAAWHCEITKRWFQVVAGESSSSNCFAD